MQLTFFSTRVCRKIFHQGLIDPELFFNRDRDRDDFFSIKPCLKIKNQRLLKKFYQGLMIES